MRLIAYSALPYLEILLANFWVLGIDAITVGFWSAVYIPKHFLFFHIKQKCSKEQYLLSWVCSGAPHYKLDKA